MPLPLLPALSFALIKSRVKGILTVSLLATLKNARIAGATLRIARLYVRVLGCKFVPSFTVSLAGIKSGRAKAAQGIYFVGDKFKMHRIAARPIATKMVNRKAARRVVWDWANKPSVCNLVRFKWLPSQAKTAVAVGRSRPRPIPARRTAPLNLRVNKNLLKEALNFFKEKVAYVKCALDNQRRGIGGQYPDTFFTSSPLGITGIRAGFTFFIMSVWLATVQTKVIDGLSGLAVRAEFGDSVSGHAVQPPMLNCVARLVQVLPTLVRAAFILPQWQQIRT